MTRVPFSAGARGLVMTTPVESLMDSIRQTVSSLRRDAPAARFIGEQVVKMLCRSVGHKFRDLSHLHQRQQDFGQPVSVLIEKPVEAPVEAAVISEDAGSNEALPWPQYDVMSARDIVSRLKASPPELCVAVHNYEICHRARATVLTACGSGRG